MPQEQADRRRVKLRQEMRSRKGREPSAARMAWCDWSILVTNLPLSLMTSKEAVVLYCARWQVEIFQPDYRSSRTLYLRGVAA